MDNKPVSMSRTLLAGLVSGLFTFGSVANGLLLGAGVAAVGDIAGDRWAHVYAVPAAVSGFMAGLAGRAHAMRWVRVRLGLS